MPVKALVVLLVVPDGRFHSGELRVGVVAAVVVAASAVADVVANELAVKAVVVGASK
jgi:hypothetical protein